MNVFYAMPQRAAEAGAKILVEPKAQFYGERSSKIQDPFGHVWMLGQHVEEFTLEEMQRRDTELLSTLMGLALAATGRPLAQIYICSGRAGWRCLGPPEF